MAFPKGKKAMPFGKKGAKKKAGKKVAAKGFKGIAKRGSKGGY